MRSGSVWLVETKNVNYYRKTIVVRDIDTNEEMDRIDVPELYPALHGLPAYLGGIIYCDFSIG